MRIFYAADRSPNASFQSNLWRSNLLLALQSLGHDVVEFQYDLSETFRHLDKTDPLDLLFIRKNRPKVTSELLRQLRLRHSERPFDLFFSYFYDACILPDAIEEIKSLGIKTVNWYCNSSYQLHLVSEIAPHYDWCFIPEKFRMEDYTRLGANPIHVGEAANPDVYVPLDLPKDYDVTFVGQAYGERPALINYLLQNGVDVKVWGYGWSPYIVGTRLKDRLPRVQRIGNVLLKMTTRESRRAVLSKMRRYFGRPMMQKVIAQPLLAPGIYGGILHDEQMIKIFSRSRINLGFSACGDTHLSDQRVVQVRLRDFEVPMTGGFYLVEYMEELEQFYEIGKEIACYRNREELLDKVRYYLSHDTERESIRIAGMRRARTEHTWQKRFENVFLQLGLPRNVQPNRQS